MQVFKATGDSERLKVWVAGECSGSSLMLGRSGLWPSSRWQKLKWPGVWMKREDELSFTLSGPKFRKFCGLAPILKSCRGFVAIGSARSAFLLGLAQICKEENKKLELILLRSTPYQEFGTDLLYQNAFDAFPQHWLSREEWPNASQIARDLANKQDGLLVLPEGGACREALAGALSLALDLKEQMEALAIPIDDVWMDSGSGFTAQALIWGLGTLLEHPPKVHVVLCAGTEKDFESGLMLRREEAEASLAVRWQKAPYQCHRPITAASYGSTNRRVWDKVMSFHQDHGVLLDPLYTAKLMLTYEAFREADKGREIPTLILHSGGALNNFGFRDGLRPLKTPSA